MDRLIAEIRTAIQANLFTLGLQGTLALIDICAALSSESGKTNGPQFRAWYREHLSDVASFLEAEDAYKLRCGILHQGHATAKNYNAVLVTLPSSNTFHNNIMNDAINLDFERFCGGILERIEAWWKSAQHTEPVRTNAESLIRIRPEGMAPYMVGMPVLA